MSRITIVYTRHEEFRNCNSHNLLKIIERVHPEVIFEELSQANFHRAYDEESLNTLETTAIKKYINGHKVVHIPVDTFPRSIEYDESIDRLYSRLTGGISQEAFHFRQLLRQLPEFAGEYGFEFLNSSANDDYLSKVDMLKSQILEQLKDDSLDQLHNAEIKMLENRETEILRNIYAFSRDNEYKEGLMFIGSGHRRSLTTLIKTFQEEEKLKLIWRFYPF